LINSIGEKVEYKDKELAVGVSIGAAIFPDHAENIVNLRKKADEIMYKVKASGKNNYMLADN